MLEGVNARLLAPGDLPGPPATLAVVDVSFISLALVLPPIVGVLAHPYRLLPMVKPQFEAGRDEVRKGVVRDPGVHGAVLERVAAAATEAGGVVLGACETRPSRPCRQPRVLPAHRLERPSRRPRTPRPTRYRCCAMPSPDRLTVRRVALQARRSAGDAADLVARLAAEAGVELLPPDADVAEADLVIVLGGDGSVLRALQQVTGKGVPVFGINFGRVGFLTTAEPGELETAVRRALAGELRVVELATVQAERAGEAPAFAVNDVVVASDVQGRIARLGWNVDGVDLGELACDAVVVCTPAGSTGYALSAGGPVLDWGVEAMGVTFVAPHTLTARPLVLPRGAVVEVANRARELTVRLILDGVQSDRALEPGESVTVCLGPERTALGLLPEVAFLQRYRDAFTR